MREHQIRVVDPSCSPDRRPSKNTVMMMMGGARAPLLLGIRSLSVRTTSSKCIARVRAYPYAARATRIRCCSSKRSNSNLDYPRCFPQTQADVAASPIDVRERCDRAEDVVFPLSSPFGLISRIGLCAMAGAVRDVDPW